MASYTWLADVVLSLYLPLHSLTLRRFHCHYSLPPAHLPFISLRPWELRNTPEPASSSCTWGIHEADKIVTLWKPGHIWFWQMSLCHLYICHFICITQRGLFIHIVPNHNQFHITIGFFPLPLVTHPILWIHVDNLHCCLLHHAISCSISYWSRSSFDLLTLHSLLFVFHNSQHLCGVSHQPVHTFLRIKQTEWCVTGQNEYHCTISIYICLTQHSNLRRCFTICPTFVQCWYKIPAALPFEITFFYLKFPD